MTSWAYDWDTNTLNCTPQYTQWDNLDYSVPDHYQAPQQQQQQQLLQFEQQDIQVHTTTPGLLHPPLHQKNLQNVVKNEVNVDILQNII